MSSVTYVKVVESKMSGKTFRLLFVCALICLPAAFGDVGVNSETTLKDAFDDLLAQFESLQTRVDKQDKRNIELKEELTKLTEKQRTDKWLNGGWRRKRSSNVGGAVYVRWGRTVCPYYSTLIYEGFAAGSYYYHTGGGSTKICLPKRPQWRRIMHGFQSQNYIYGAEYEVHKNHPFYTSNTRGHALHDSNAVCAVCLARSRPSHVMIPAYTRCPAGWTTEYTGYLMSSHFQQTKTSYDCVDLAPEVANAGSTNKDGSLFYLTECDCGYSLPCPPYIHGAELTCVVCTK